MKRAKLMLAAIAVFAVIGGVYASKSSRITQFVFISDSESTTNACTSQLFGYTTLPNLSVPTTITASFKSTTLPCPTLRVYPTV
jgi:hypothetical protein